MIPQQIGRDFRLSFPCAVASLLYIFASSLQILIFRASMGLSFFILLIEYIMVANTTRNTLSTAMPMAADGRRKEVS